MRCLFFWVFVAVFISFTLSPAGVRTETEGKIAAEQQQEYTTRKKWRREREEGRKEGREKEEGSQGCDVREMLMRCDAVTCIASLIVFVYAMFPSHTAVSLFLFFFCSSFNNNLLAYPFCPPTT